MYQKINNQAMTSNNFYGNCVEDSVSLIKLRMKKVLKNFQMYFNVNKLNSLFDFSDPETKNQAHLVDLSNYNFS